MKKKLLAFIFSFAFLFLGCMTPTCAAEVSAPSKYEGPMPSNLMEYTIIYRTYNGTTQKYRYQIITSDHPAYYSRDAFRLPDGSKYYTADCYFYNDEYHFTEEGFERTVMGENNSTIIYSGGLSSPPSGFESNHTIKNEDNGTDFFTVPPLVALVKQLEEGVMVNLPLIAGSMIFLVVLVVSLVVLVRFFRGCWTRF